jgi:hypothetical protein
MVFYPSDFMEKNPNITLEDCVLPEKKLLRYGKQVTKHRKYLLNKAREIVKGQNQELADVKKAADRLAKKADKL